ncbi:MAG: hypothetical protein B7X70_13920 [Acidovorax sp. 39-64-12]|jgi:hypothetical protein|nr:MAG: hypothetical protein B7Y64_13150 [Acidovorax sp. 35-64-16]OZA68624.1 MAG: hypothetical protein B7X70_13920 [Acidovorax sp. 39-64-12]
MGTNRAARKGCDAGESSDIKRNIAVDTHGLLHTMQVTTTEVTDRKGALQAFNRCKTALGRVQNVPTDNDYTKKPFVLGGRVKLCLEEKNKRLWKSCERKLNTSLQFVHLALLALLLRNS